VTVGRADRSAVNVSNFYEREVGSGIGGYEVGFAKPPQGTQFRKGRSGNPNGRPKGAKSIANILAKMGRERVRITTNGSSTALWLIREKGNSKGD
jgi:hypothetical protein